jgi:hypothetical protein
MYNLLIINLQHVEMDVTPKEEGKKIKTNWTKVQEDAKGKAGVS